MLAAEKATWFGAHFLASAAETGSRTALVFEDRSWTYTELDLLIRQAVRCLRAVGVGKGDRVVMQGVPRPEAISALFAVTRMGAILVPLHPQITENELAVICEETSPRAIIADSSFVGHRLADAGAALLAWDELCAGDRSTGEHVREAPDGSDVAIIPFTSGTSGRPKGVALTHDNLYWSMVNGFAGLPMEDREVALIATPLAHVAVLGGLPQYTWARRGTVVLAPRFDPGLFIDLVRDHKVTTAFAVPAMLTLLVRHPRFHSADMDSLRWVLAGGAPAVSTTATRFDDRGIHIVNSYGLTESCAGVTYAAGEDVADHPTSVGRPMPHVELRVMDDKGVPAPAEAVGEIWLRGPSIAASYWTRAGLLPVADPDGWFHTGDRGRFDARGRLEVVGRVKDTIITGGENVDPAEVENILAGLPGVLDVAVCGLPDPVWGEIVTAFVVVGTREVSLDDIRKYVEGKLTKHKWPRQLFLVEMLPRGATGKIQRQKLIDLACHSTSAGRDRQPSPSSSAPAPRSNP
ncbi:AMP-binding protein [Nocardia sp. NBC_00881]|uniref:class I adenylate-forming enzyme family protein n=1 Tax=Nocardia sp. NBC_00881 TaxID=2975995 RepID=UPI00386890F9|nr:AMP-binding protein [Nocardia sp. NBC_00881]